MSSSSCYNSQPRGFLTPPPTWKKSRCSPAAPGSEKKTRRSPQAKADLFHVIHKVPAGDSPYVRAKHVQMIDKDPSRAISLFWTAINSGDRVDSALKDMAVVMKQLDRSDEAIEAIKSFRHLCPLESQEPLDNILLELYKQSGRIEEEIELLQLKLKQVEEGLAFGGKRLKMARSQGKKIQITVEKEYSRLLGNLAWAYMQKKDFKSAEEHYRKALSFEADKNKQCNLAMCLMHLNKLSEAKFLLQAIRGSKDNGHMTESYAKSYERASQMLVELEKQHAHVPMRQMEHNNKPFGAWDSGFGFQKYSDHNKGGPFTEFPYEKRADFDWRRNHYNGQARGDFSDKRTYESPFCNGRIPKVPFTQPRKCSWSVRYGDKNGGGLGEKENGGFCRKLSFQQSTNSKNLLSVVNNNLSYHSTASATVMPRISEKHLPTCAGDWTKNSTGKCKKSWADMVEEDDEELDSTKSDFPQNSGKPSQEQQPFLLSYQTPDRSSAGTMNTEEFNDENVNSNIISETSQTEKLMQKIESINLGCEYFTQPEKTTLSSMNTSVRRSLCFDQNQKPASPLPMKALNFEGSSLVLSEDYFTCSKPTKRRQRLQVFQDITCLPGSPRP